MSYLSCNCRGLENPGTVQELATIMRENDPSVVFLSDTWMDDDHLEFYVVVFISVINLLRKEETKVMARHSEIMGQRTRNERQIRGFGTLLMSVILLTWATEVHLSLGVIT
jgi:hypothetical protein